MAPLPRKFDHEEAKRRRADGVPVSQLAREYGVTVNAIYRVTDERWRAQQNAYKKQWLRAHYRKPCAGGCGRLVWKTGTQRSGLCPACLGLTRRTAAHGTESRYSAGCHCLECRAAASEAKRQRRLASRVPCSHGCGRMVDSINRRNPDKPPECQPCSRARIAAERKVFA